MRFRRYRRDGGEPPGAGSSPAKPPEQCVAREITEETGLPAEVTIVRHECRGCRRKRRSRQPSKRDATARSNIATWATASRIIGRRAN
ncbi:NUDIX domain-containing protein [Amycolatopsis sp. NBC_01307]|uniref:NUDIX domain-containing protein n=1 Tax=Amycolatopsis sp. NBC_01307 TaxID=2903561 RepID=UPI003FA385F7